MFGIRGTIVAVAATFLYKELGLERLLTKEGRENFYENIGQEIADKFAAVKAPGLVGGIAAGGLFATLGFKKLALGAIVGGLIFDFLGLERIGTEQGQDAILADIKESFQSAIEAIPDFDLAVSYTHLTLPTKRIV